MPHEIYRDGDRDSMMYVGQVPWHGLGTQLQTPPTAAQAIVAANLNWRVVMKPLFVADENLRGLERYDDFYVTVREDLWGQQDCPFLGMVSGKYKPLQNTDAFSFFDPIIEKGTATYETAGALGNGERVWVMVKIKDSIQVAGQDAIDRYLLLSNSHDGNSSVQIKFTPVRVVCQNTLVMALSDGPSIRISHTRDMRCRLDDAQLIMTRILTYYKSLADTFDAMAKVSMGTDRLTEYLFEVFPDPRDPEDSRAFQTVLKQRSNACFLFDAGTGNATPGVAGTLWAAYNGVTELVDHLSSYASPQSRLSSVMFGDGFSIKARAFRIARNKMATWRN